eukprot:TRINITY_DN2588_c0_g7_i1.p1 TRINITY_DN2588_c0_g7~~TRINITY_DN2588_c0_g7_i1.p1  ORF type:complete len:258 (+),score=88.53 TRINITY_DN2588_c0_g7_i1:69-842(+)
MDPNEEQCMEIEALQSIFMDDFKSVSDEPPRQYELTVVPNPGDSGDNHVTAILQVTYPNEYPNEPPQVVVRAGKGLTNSQRTQLQTLVDQSISDQLGMAMVFNLTETVKEFLQQHNVKQLSMHEQMQQRKQIEEIIAEAKEEKKQDRVSEAIKHGTPVTPEIFAEWNARFLAEVQVKKEQQQKEQSNFDPDKKYRLTGKKIFLELQQAGLNINLDGLSPEEAAEQGQKADRVFFIDENLYADDDIPDDFSDEEEEKE